MAPSDEAPLRLTATTAKGLEEVTAGELRRLGAAEVEAQTAAVRFAGDRALLCRANLWLRSASRVLLELGSWEIAGPGELYEAAGAIAWEDRFAPGATLCVRASARDAVDIGIRNAHFAALKVKDAVCDRLVARRGARPDVDLDDPDVTIRLRIVGRRAELALDTTGPALDRRGYRVEAAGRVAAPCRPSLAAAIVLMSGYDGSGPLVDPFCGSATLPIEAAWVALDRAPSLLRTEPFAFTRWPDHDAAAWRGAVGEATARAEASEARELPPIIGSDVDVGALRAARATVDAAELEERIRIERRDAAEAAPPEGAADAGAGIVITNPPYGERLGEREDLGALYRALGDALKRRFGGWKAWVLCGNPQLAKSVGLRPKRRHVLWNGAIECRLLEYELY